MAKSNAGQWVAIIIVAIAFAIFVANAVYMSGIVKALSSGTSDLKLSKGGAEAFLWIDSILAGISGLLLIYLLYMMFSGISAAHKVPELTPAKV